MKRFLIATALVAALIPTTMAPALAVDSGPTPSSVSCSVVYNAQGGVMVDTSTQTVASGGTLTLRTTLYGPGNFNGWFTSPFQGYDVVPAAGTFVGFGTQVVASPCTSGASTTLYAHWSAPTAQPIRILT